MRRSRGPHIPGPIGEKTPFKKVLKADRTIDYPTSIIQQEEAAKATKSKPLVPPSADASYRGNALYLKKILDSLEKSIQKYGYLPASTNSEPQRNEPSSKSPDQNKSLQPPKSINRSVDEPDMDK